MFINYSLSRARGKFVFSTCIDGLIGSLRVATVGLSPLSGRGFSPTNLGPTLAILVPVTGY